MTRKVFVTGATGYLGSAITARLVRAGHDVRALARSPEGAATVKALGATAVIGRLEEPGSPIAEMKNCDAVVHAAIDDADQEATDQAALEIIRTAAHDGRVRRVLYTSSIWVHGDTRGAIVDETAPPAPAERARWRPAHEQAAIDLEGAEVATVVFRPGVVYGGRRGILGEWFEEAKSKGTVTYPGDGAQRWGLVHRDDMAEGYALALEHARGGERYLLVDESRLTVRELAEAVAAASRARAIPRDRRELVEALGPYGAALLLDQQFTSARARRELGWVPRHTSFVAEAGSLLREWESAAGAAVSQAPGD
ncbi:MAG: NAD-dependent epimerase/dehydratase family protein [Candidatus Eiseniibacteriota bacterium]